MEYWNNGEKNTSADSVSMVQTFEHSNYPTFIAASPSRRFTVSPRLRFTPSPLRLAVPRAWFLLPSLLCTLTSDV